MPTTYYIGEGQTDNVSFVPGSVYVIDPSTGIAEGFGEGVAPWPTVGYFPTLSPPTPKGAWFALYFPTTQGKVELSPDFNAGGPVTGWNLSPSGPLSASVTVPPGAAADPANESYYVCYNKGLLDGGAATHTYYWAVVVAANPPATPLLTATPLPDAAASTIRTTTT